jgi:hypothetical protein
VLAEIIQPTPKQPFELAEFLGPERSRQKHLELTDLPKGTGRPEKIESSYSFYALSFFHRFFISSALTGAESA